MTSVTLRAHYDGKHIVLDEPFEIPVNAPLLISIFPAVGSERDRGQEGANWASLSAQGLARAYSDDEPEYTVADLKS